MRRSLAIGLALLIALAAFVLFARLRGGAPMERIDDASRAQLEAILREEGD